MPLTPVNALVDRFCKSIADLQIQRKLPEEELCQAVIEACEIVAERRREKLANLEAERE